MTGHVGKPYLLIRMTVPWSDRYKGRRAHDVSYRLHAAVASAFAVDDSPAKTPFSCYSVDEQRRRRWTQKDRDRHVPILAYALESTWREAQAQTANSASVEVKAMPFLASGQKLAFQIRACPTVRTRADKDGCYKSNGTRNKLRVLDAWQHAKITNPNITADEAYASWLRAKLAGAAHLPGASDDDTPETILIVERSTQRVYRKNLKGKLALPNVLFKGVLTVTDADQFNALVARGIGRQRAFGFGMLLLRPV